MISAPARSTAGLCPGRGIQGDLRLLKTPFPHHSVLRVGLDAAWDSALLQPVVKFPWPNLHGKVQFTTRQNGSTLRGQPSYSQIQRICCTPPDTQSARPAATLEQ
eukprot:891987-Rhodomonas_salina.2